MAVTPPTDAELDTWIRARLALLGIDLTQLDATATDPETGSPSQAAVLASLRGLLRTTVPLISGWKPPAGGGPDEDRLQQQVAPPQVYPATATAWTGSTW